MNSIDATHAFDGKAQAYVQSRPDYAREAIEAICAIAGLGRHSVIADLGAGTGMLARHFAERVGALYAIEPNADMRNAARASLGPFAAVQVMDGTADATGLPERSVDVVTAGRSIHWFDRERSLAEFRRILRPGGWLVVVRTPVRGTYSSLALERIKDPSVSRDDGVRRQRPSPDEADAYFGGANYVRLEYPCVVRETWLQFLGRVQSLSSAPQPGEAKHDAFLRTAREIFDAGAVGGSLAFEYATEVLMKRIAPAPLSHPFPLAEAAIEGDVATRFEEVAARFAKSVALRFGGQSWTYARLDAWANAVARLVLRESPDASRPVALLFDHGAEGIAAMLGVLKAGRAYCVLSAAHSVERNREVLSDLQAVVLLHGQSQDDAARALAQTGLRCRPILPAAMDAADGLPVRGERSADTVAAIYYTSGTTGQPKGIAHNHRGLLHRAWVSGELFGPAPGCPMAQLTDLAAYSSAADVFVPLLWGATVCPFDTRVHTLRELAQWLHDERIEVVRMPVALFHTFLEALRDGEHFAHVRFLHPSGKLHRTTVDRYRRHFPRTCRLVRQLASTESSLLTTSLVDDDNPTSETSSSVGYPISGKHVWLEDGEGGRAAPGNVGEIVVESRYLFAGVWGEPGTWKGAGHARVHRTGDLGRWLPDGSLEFIGRRDARVKIRGYTVDVEQVEGALGNLAQVVDVAVIADEDPRGEARLVAYVVPARAGLTAAEVRTELSARMPNYMVPAHIRLLDTLPLTANGKVDRAVLSQRVAASREATAGFVAPRTAIEAGVAGIWEEVLARAPIGADDDFLEAGGDSLSAARIAHRVAEAFAVELSQRDLFETSTIARMARLVEQRLPRGAQ